MEPIKNDKLFVCAALIDQITNFIPKEYDVITIHDTDKIDPNQYKIVVIYSCSLFRECCNLTYEQIDNKFIFIRNIRYKVLLAIDLHPYTFKHLSSLKDAFPKFMLKHKIEYMVAVYDCPECKYWLKKLSNIKKFYVTNNGYKHSLYYPINTHKEYDVLVYGAHKRSVYPFRVRLRNLLSKIGIRIKIIERKDNIFGNDMSKMINKSWISISCVSIYSYYVYKYREISSSNSVIIGDTNNQCNNVIEYNMILVHNGMSDTQIMNKFIYYLNNKEILSAITFNLYPKIEKEGFDTHFNNINNIANDIVNGNVSPFEYNPNITYPPINYNICHDKKQIILNLIDGQIANVLDAGLYTLKTNYSDFDVLDENNNIISRRNMYTSDILLPNIYYVSFILQNIGKISLSNITSDMQLELFKISKHNKVF